MRSEVLIMFAGIVVFGGVLTAVPRYFFASHAAESATMAAVREGVLPNPETSSVVKTEAPAATQSTAARDPGASTYVSAEVYPDVWPVRDWDVPDPVLIASSSLVFLASEEKVLFESNPRAPLPIASITKLLTALVALERAEPEAALTVSPEALAVAGISKLAAGDRFTLAQLILFMLLPSSNDAAQTLWLHLGREDFIRVLNEKARELGMKDSHFVNASGLDEESASVPADAQGGSSEALFNAASAYDTALLMRAVLQNEFLTRSIGLEHITISSQGGRSVSLNNSNKLLGKMPRVIGGKTGFTDEARETFVVATTEGERQANVIYVILGSRDRLADMRALIDWTRNAYKF
ncbi:MAG: serine hydrolase [Patescibacteria group bacterium]|nr:serine hydrolase [Patescibacteria group bacterium]